MFNFCRRKPEKPDYLKIFAVTLTITAAVCAGAYVIFRLFNKYFSISSCECEDFIDDGCDDCDVCFEDEADAAEEVEAN